MKVRIPSPIGKWTAIKLEHLDNYLQAYRTVTKKAKGAHYLDLLAGCGECVLKTNGQPVEGSPWRALNCVPRFSAYYFVEENAHKARHLKRAVRGKDIDNAFTYPGDCNTVVPEKVLPQVPQDVPSFAFIDPYGLQVHWETIRALASHRKPLKMELLILYPAMAVDRILPRSHEPQIAQRLSLFFGGASWEEEWGQSQKWREDAKQRQQRFVHFYARGLTCLGYKHVVPYEPMRSSRNQPLYQMIFAGDNDVGAKIMKDVWSKLRFVPGELGYHPVQRPRSK